MLPHDVRHALRRLRKSPAFSAAAVATIALGIAANTAVFSVVNAALLRALPFAQPDRLMQVAERNDKLNLPYFSASTLNYVSWKEMSRSFARKFWGGDDPIGKVVHRTVRTPGTPEAALPTIRQRVRALDADLPISSVQTLEQTVSASASQPRLNALLLVVFAAVSLIVAGIGIYGVLAYSVSNRTNEFGLRMARGAARRQVMRLVVGEGMVVGLAGTAVGLVAAGAMSRVLARLLFGVEPRDPLTFGGAAASLVVVALLACAAPAWRASRVDPSVALRQD